MTGKTLITKSKVNEKKRPIPVQSLYSNVRHQLAVYSLPSYQYSCEYTRRLISCMHADNINLAEVNHVTCGR